MMILFPLLSLIACDDKISDTANQLDTSVIGKGEEELPVPSEIVLSNTNLMLTYLGETTNITAMVLDQFGEPFEAESILWNIPDSSCASIDEHGVITAINNGQTTVTASLNSLFAQAEITVSQVAKEITVSPTELVFSKFGDSQELTTTVKDAGGSIMSPTVLWESTDTNIITVDSNGLVMAINNGTADVLASIDSLSISVTAQVSVVSFTLDSDGYTVLCPYAMAGDSGEINGVTYTKRDRAALDILIQNRDWNAISTSCTSGIQDMSFLFYNVYEDFEDIRSWDVSSVTDTERMFYNAGFFNQDIGHWNVSNVTKMKGMLDGAFMFNQDIGDWDVSSVTDFSTMFSSAAAFNQDIGDWDVSSAINMAEMFYDTNDFNQDISGWDVSQVTNMSEMFYDAVVFNQDLSTWCVENITSEPYNFVSDYSDWTLPKPIWGICAN